MQVGVISDTHGLVRPEALAALARSELILHAGDIGGPHVLAALEEIAPVEAVRGNVDEPAYLRSGRSRRLDPDWARDLPTAVALEREGVRVHLTHDVSTVEFGRLQADLLVVGHSHLPRIDPRGELLVVNPGSAGPRRFRLPVAVARLRLQQGRIEAVVVELAV